MKRFGFLRRGGNELPTTSEQSDNASKKLPRVKKGSPIKEKALIFHTDFTAEERDIEIYNGIGLIKYGEPIGDKEFIIDQCRPIIVNQEGGFFGKKGRKMLYLLKWDRLKPCSMIIDHKNPNGSDYIEVGFQPNGNEIRETLAPFDVGFGQQKGEFKDITPDIMRQTYDLRFLKHMKKYATEEPKKRFGFGSGKGVMALIIFVAVFLCTFLFSYSYLGGFG